MSTTKTTEFRVVSETVGESVNVVSVTGELDIATVSGLRTALAEATDGGASRLVVDLSRVTFVDSVGVGAILHAKKRLAAPGLMAIVVPSQSYAGMIFDVVGADALVEVFEARPPAVAHVS